MEEKKTNFDQFFNNLKEYAETRADIIKIEVVDRVSSATSTLATMLILMAGGILFLLFASFGAAWLIGQAAGNIAIGFFSIAGFYLIASIIIYAFRDTLIKIPVINVMLKQLTDDK
ncbi:MAG: hypothetical protein ABIT08_06815 [Bacteroidia bacterium]